MEACSQRLRDVFFGREEEKSRVIIFMHTFITKITWPETGCIAAFDR